MSADWVDNVEAAEDLLADALGVVLMAVGPGSEPTDDPELEAMRLVISSHEPFVSLQLLADRLGDYCRPTCAANGAPHGDVEYDCGCPCHDRS